MQFPEWFFSGLVYLSLALTTGGILTLGVLVAKDQSGGKLW